jgi:DNA-binding CsgD family transcriptional regulator
VHHALPRNRGRAQCRLNNWPPIRLAAPIIRKNLGFARAAGAIRVIVPMGTAAAAFTPRETEIVRLMAQGLSPVEIAVRMFVSIEAVEEDQRQIARKLGVADVSQIIPRAIGEGVIDG